MIENIDTDSSSYCNDYGGQYELSADNSEAFSTYYNDFGGQNEDSVDNSEPLRNCMEIEVTKEQNKNILEIMVDLCDSFNPLEKYDVEMNVINLERFKFYELDWQSGLL